MYKFKLKRLMKQNRIWLLLLCVSLVSIFVASYATRTPKESKSGFAALIGDANGDGKVDILDFQILSNTFGKISGDPGYDGRADFNGDNAIDILDFQILSNNFGTVAPTVTPTRSITITPSVRPTNTVTPRLTVTPTLRPTPTISGPTLTPFPTGTGTACSSLSGIEKRFPCSSLQIGNMPGNTTSGTDPWDMFSNMLYQGIPNIGNPPHFAAVANPSGSGAVVRNLNYLKDSEKHTTVGTSRDLPLGSTECSAFRWFWKSQAEFPQRGWALIWQLQMSGSPIVAVETDQSSHNWFFRSRNGSDTGLEYNLGPILFGHWAYFTVCTHLADAPAGWTKIWFKNDGWPDVNASPTYQRSGHDTYQGTTGHNTIGIYAAHDGTDTSYYGYFDRYGRATTPQRAVSIAGNP